MAPPRSRELTFERSGLTFRATVEGPAGGVPVVLLHGFPGSRATWERTVAELRGSGLTTAALEQRGYGRGARPAGVGAYRLPELAADVLAFLDVLGAERCHLVGHDWGGMVAWYLGATAPARLASLTVLSTPHPRAYAAAMLRSAQSARSIYALAFQFPAVPEAFLTVAGARVLRTSLERSGLDRATAQRYAAHLGTPEAMRAALHWYRAAFRHPGDSRAVGAIDVPTTYVWSTRDVALGRTAAETTGQHVTGPYRFVVLDGVSHWIPETRAARTATLIVETVERA
jgi:pimeloyl-ACP methyl ester carboxylesterase